MQRDTCPARSFHFGPAGILRLLGSLLLFMMGLLSLLGIAEAHDPAADVIAPLCLLFVGGWGLWRRIRGIPSVTINEHGLICRSTFGVRTYPWPQIGRFEPIKSGWLWRRHVIIGAWAPVLTTKRRARIVLHDVFDTPLESMRNRITQFQDLGIADEVTSACRPDYAMPASGWSFPWMTMALLGVLVFFFFIERDVAAASGEPAEPLPLGTLVAMGGVSRALVVSGDWWRLFTAPFLHASWVHLIANSISFVFAGYALEKILGPVWMLCVFMLGALAGSIASITLMGSPVIVSVGASGAIMAMFLCLLVLCGLLPPGSFKNIVASQSVRIVLPALLPFGDGAGPAIDYGAHFGGALLGLLVGLALTRHWRAFQLSRFSSAAMCIVVCGMICCTAAAAEGYAHFPAIIRAEKRLIPMSRLRHTIPELLAWSSQLLLDYPYDPVAYFLAGDAAIQRHDIKGAESLLRAGLVIYDQNPAARPKTVSNNMSGLLALVLNLDRDRSQAMVVARSACTARAGEMPEQVFLKALKQNGLCEALPP